MPSARCVGFKKTIWQDIGGFSEFLSRTGEDTLFDVNYRRYSRAWAINKAAVVEWFSPETEEQFDKLCYSYALGDGESGYGDQYYFYERLAELKRGKLLNRVSEKAFAGYLEGRRRRTHVELVKRKIVGVVLVLAGVPFSDIGGGQRGTQLALAMIYQGYKVVFVNIYPSYETKPLKPYLNVDWSLLELCGIDDFDVEEFTQRYREAECMCIFEFPHPQLSAASANASCTKTEFKNRI